MKKKYFFIFAATLLAPLTALALNLPPLNPGGPIDVSSIIDTMFTYLWVLFAALAILMFIMAGVSFLTASGDPGKIKTARTMVLWGIVGVLVGVLAFSAPLLITQLIGV
jgi:hypothetical protein